MSDPPTYDSLRTRWSLLSRIKDWGDRESWREFFDTCQELIFNVARKAGLTETEAEEVVQETIITVAKKMPEFKTDPKAGSFKAWLLHTTRWEIGDQFRKRKPDQQRPGRDRGDETERGTATIERIPDPAALAPEETWEAAWQQNLFQLALKRVQETTRARHFQIFRLHVVHDTPAQKVARQLGVNVAQVYLVKHRLSGLLKKEVNKLQKELERPQN